MHSLPHIIDNGLGEKLIFLSAESQPDGDKLWVENFVDPGVGPPMHTHWQQEECLTVVKGRIGYQVKGEPVRYAGVGETVLFRRGVAHRFWNAGKEILHCQGWIHPANSIVFYLSGIFEAQKKAGSMQPERFDGAYLLTRYKSEYDLSDLPPFVKRVVLPATYRVGKWLGKYEHFKQAPAPLKPVKVPAY